MIKEIVTYTDFEDNQEIEKEETLRFAYTPPAVKNYEAETGKPFFESYNEAFSQLATVLDGGVDLANLSESDALKLFPIMTDPTINTFLMEFIPCLYAKVEDNRLVQSVVTVEEAQESLWLMELVNIEFFLQVFNEISGKTLQDKKPKAKKKAKKA